ncbi:MAG: hypothetical protein AAFZ11_04425 [Pseudomonadota bacterium]
MQKTNGSTFNPNSTGIVPADTTDVSYGSGFTASGNGIQCGFDGTVRVVVGVFASGTVTRASFRLRAAIDGTEIGPIFNQSYHRNANGQNENGSVIPGYLLTVSNGEVVTATHAAQGAGGTLTTPVGDAFLLVERVA